MESHRYTFEFRDLVWVTLAPLIPVLLFPAVMHLIAMIGWLPPAHQALDMERTIITFQARAVEQRHESRNVFIGDSSCLMGVDAAALTEELNEPALNLGTISLLDLKAYGALLRRYFENNPDGRERVILLLHPEALRRAGPKLFYVDFLEAMMAGRAHHYPTRNFEYVLDVLELDRFRDHVLTRLLPRPLPGAYGRHYGFNRELWRYLSEHRGSAIDPVHVEIAGDPYYDLNPALAEASRLFRGSIPDDVPLWIGITPVPESFAHGGYQEDWRSMLERWKEWLDAERVLGELPAVLPDRLFASVTHLNEEGRAYYTELIAEAIEE